jgi:glutamine amidotransferase
MIVIIDYGLGNLGSIANMLKKVRVEAIISSNTETIKNADKLILPGVGAFDHGMTNLEDRGLIPILNELVFENKIPILGLCLGMQLFTRGSEEGDKPGLGWIDAETVRFRFDPVQTGLKIPHMGWNSVQPKAESPIWHQWHGEETRFYFVHSYHVKCQYERNVLATTNYGYEFPSMIIQSNIIGTQFHPEKSHKYGMKLMSNFAECFK